MRAAGTVQTTNKGRWHEGKGGRERKRKEGERGRIETETKAKVAFGEEK